MKSYSEIPLSDVLSLSLRPVVVESTSTFPTAGVYSFGRGMLVRGTISGSDTKYARLYQVQVDDFVLSRLKAFEGAVAVVDRGSSGRFVSQEFPTFVIDSDRCLPRYMHHVCTWPAFWERLAGGSKGVGSRRERVHVDQLLAVTVPLPTLNEQRRLCTILDRAAEALEVAPQRFEHLGVALRSSALRACISDEGDEFSVGDVIKLVREPVELLPDHKYVEIGIRSFGKGTFRKAPVSGAALGDKRVYSIRPNELVFSNVFAWEGAIAVTTDADKGAIGSHRFMTYEVEAVRADLRYLAYYFQSERGLEVVRAASPGSAGRNRTLGIEAFAQQTVRLPTIMEQRHVADALDLVFGRLARLARERDRLRVAARKSLLNAAFSARL